MACGTPVIALRAGGALETIVEGVTGEFFDQQTVESLQNDLEHYNTRVYYSEKIREHALKFDNLVFQKKIKVFVESKYENRT